jgi:LacI family transcriptional regulator
VGDYRVPRQKARSSRRRSAAPGVQPVTLKTLADHLGLSPATISIVINRSPAARSIPSRTQERVLAAARQLNYRPNSLARSLQRQRSFTIGVLVPEISEGYAAMVMGGIEDYLLQEGYLYFVASHRHRADLIDEYPRLLLERKVEGLIAVDTPCRQNLPVPVVAVWATAVQMASRTSR